MRQHTPTALETRQRFHWRWDVLLFGNASWAITSLAAALILLLVGSIFFLVWLSWLLLGANIDGRLTWRFSLQSHVEMVTVDFTSNGKPHQVKDALDMSDLRRLGLPARLALQPGQIGLQAIIPVRIFPGFALLARPVYPWTATWHVLILPGIVLIVSICWLRLSREVLRTLRLSRDLMRGGILTDGKVLEVFQIQTFPFGSGDQLWVKYYRFYVDYEFRDETGKEHTGSMRVFNAKNWPPQAGETITVFYDPTNFRRSIAADYCPAKLA